jgi:putative redox protein
MLQAANKISSSVAVATIGAPCDPEHVTHLLESDREEIEKNGEAEVNLAGRTFRIKKQFLDDLEETNMQEKIRNLRRALLIFHSPLDNTVGIDNAARIFRNAMHPKSFISLDKADHLLTDEADSFYVGAVLAAWAAKYIEISPEKETGVRLTPEKNLIVTRTAAEGYYTEIMAAEGYYTEIMANGHPLIADEPVSYGGTDKGASPYELLAAGLGACTSMTLRMYAGRKQWPLEAVIVRMKHQRTHAEDCRECETRDRKIEVIEREIELFGPLDEEQKQRLLEIADKCPVHRTLHSKVLVRTRLKK